MSPSTDYEKFVNTLATFGGTLERLSRDIARLPSNARNVLQLDRDQLEETYHLARQRLNQLHKEVQATSPLLGLLAHFTKTRSLIKKLNEAVDKLDRAITHLEAGVRISQQAELGRNRREVHEEEKRLRRAMGFDSEDETVVVGSAPFRQPAFVPQVPGLTPGGTPSNMARRNASTSNIMSLDRFRGFDDAPELPTSLPPPPNRSLGMGRSQSQDPRTFAASVANLEHDFGNMDMGHLDGSEQRLPQQQNLAPRTDPNAPFPSSRRVGHRPAPSFDAFNNRLTPAQPPGSSDSRSMRSTNAPSIARRHSSSSGYSSQSYDTSVYPNSSSSGHGAGNQASPAGSMYANSASRRSSHSIVRSVSQYTPTSIQSGRQPTHSHDGGSIGLDGSQGVSVGNMSAQGGDQSGAQGMAPWNALPLSLRQVSPTSQLQAGSSSNANPRLFSGYMASGRQRSDANVVWDSPGEFEDMYVPESD
ncbi:hypothetical protein FA13DRAFT_244181 [Coprinellus micaceus]|uniref:Uncharacterized protein n=1 Tax=Coprinellus micaceus TaxID=71717 RepID=A0A4Y7SES0_COPMI|nr:hypothetical protein FA13DRAFT_244181 [Coprinellus micaceus]